MEQQLNGDGASAEVARRPRRFLRLCVCLALTAVVIVLPVPGAFVGYMQSGEPVERDLVTGAMVVAAGVCAAVWLGWGVLWFTTRITKPALDAARGGTFEISDPDLIRGLLAAHGVACAHCGYNLLGLSHGPCPECREPIRLHLSGADPVRSTRGLVWLALAAFGLHLVAGGAVVVRWWWAWQYIFSGALGFETRLFLVALPAVEILGCFVLAVASAAWIKAPSPRLRAVARLRVLQLALVLLSLVGVLTAAMIIST